MARRLVHLFPDDPPRQGHISRPALEERAKWYIINARTKGYASMCPNFDAPERKDVRGPVNGLLEQLFGVGAGAGAKHDRADMWRTIGMLKWSLMSDKLLTNAEVTQTLSELGADDKQALKDALAYFAGVLEKVPLLAKKSKSHLMQFAAFGEAWFDALKENDPTVILHLDSELQLVDLESLIR